MFRGKKSEGIGVCPLVLVSAGLGRFSSSFSWQLTAACSGPCRSFVPCVFRMLGHHLQEPVTDRFSEIQRVARFYTVAMRSKMSRVAGNDREEQKAEDIIPISDAQQSNSVRGVNP